MDKGKGFYIFFRVLCIIFACVFVISIVKYCFGSTSISFYSFLEYVSRTPQISVEYTDVISVSGSWPDWALWLKGILQVLSKVINVVWWIMRNIANLLVFVTYYLTLLLVKRV